MKKKDIPHDTSSLSFMTREIQYVQDENGEYTTGLSEGWEVKKDALDSAWDDIHDRVAEAESVVKSGLKSPIYYFMELKLMDLPILSSYTGYWIFFVKRHMKPSVFKRMSDKKLQRYADAFEISLQTLKEFGQ